MSMISYETSINMLELLSLAPTRQEKVFISDTLGRILAEDIVAPDNYPRFATSAMDGYAIIHADQEWGEIEIDGDNPAGSDIVDIVTGGKCIKTFTGSKMPQGSDTLIPIENVTAEGNAIKINESVAKGFSIRPIAESYTKGEILIKKGTKVGFAEIGVMAGVEKVMVDVAQRPRIAVISTGSEILDIGEAAKTDSQIRSTNHITIEAIAKMAGADVVQLGVIGDDKEAIMQTFENALASADIVVSTGGVSVGDYDFVKDIVPALGADVIYKGVKIKPGQHIMLAQKEGKMILALPGFAYSCTVTFILYGIPLIGRMLGKSHSLNIIEARLKEPFTKRSKKSEFTACNLSFEDGSYWVDFHNKKIGSSAILTNILGASALMLSGEDDSNLDSGMAVNVIPLDIF
ncbi:MAG: molybdopterin molybdotransferase MoeA [Campylobacterota bacterium]|nr:molybdopterin molybdotransferase MoeA [Campylobacterota bacterium]